jgi:hypothetical protein
MRCFAHWVPTARCSSLSLRESLKSSCNPFQAGSSLPQSQRILARSQSHELVVCRMRAYIQMTGLLQSKESSNRRSYLISYRDTAQQLRGEVRRVEILTLIVESEETLHACNNATWSEIYAWWDLPYGPTQSLAHIFRCHRLGPRRARG